MIFGALERGRLVFAVPFRDVAAGPPPPGRHIHSGSEVCVQRVLVVEQGEQIAELLRATLPAAGWSVAAASDAIAALELLRDGDTDLIVVDLRLPDDGALEVVRMLHENDVTASVLLLAKREDVQAAFSRLDDVPRLPCR
jgi:CheY-like chemotaxis protein